MGIFTRINPRAIGWIITIVIVAVLLGVTLFQLRFVIQGPDIEITHRHYTTDQPWVDVHLLVRNTQQLSINNVPVVPDVTGKISQRVFVSRGASVIEIDAHSKYGSQKQEYILVTYPQYEQSTVF